MLLAVYESVPPNYTGVIERLEDDDLFVEHYYKGKEHRTDGAAELWYDGTKFWWILDSAIEANSTILLVV